MDEEVVYIVFNAWHSTIGIILYLRSSPILRWVLVSHHLGEEKTLALGVENLRGLCKKKHIKLWLLGSVS